MPVSRRSAVVVHAFLGVLLLHSAPTQADELPTPADILAALQAHRDGITREWSVTVWENFWQGKQTATSIVTIHRVERELIRYQQDDYVYKRGTTEGLLWAFDGKLA